ncbi:serine/threonine-protein kinase [Prosthecobacter sp.]|uniref:serine/threonine-protein kinase n=1 Tax=Prosthecobacter sp. TaxID=1965333 RepID=UPI003782F00B
MAEAPLSSEQPSFDVPSIEAMNAYLPQFTFEKLAACGGMGAVYKAYQESLDRRVAVKILPPEFGTEKEFADRFKVEARAMAKLNHTNIVGVYDFGITAGGHLYLVMEWIEGKSLHDLIHKGSLSLRKATNLAMQLCEALTFAHEHQIIHRDIKPGNIMVNDADHVKVADFGLARPNTGEAEEENPFGTPDYAAPEIRGGSVVDHRVDIYAAGVVLYEMLTGTVPQEPRKSVTEFTKVSTRWDSIIARAIDPDPDKRYQDAGEFRAHINVAMKQAAEGGESGGNPMAIDLGIGLGGKKAAAAGPNKPAVAAQKAKPAAPAKKPAAPMTQQQQLMLMIGVVAVVVVGFMALLFWPSSRSGGSAGVKVEATADEILEVMEKLAQNDSELARMVNSFAEDWKAAGADRNPGSDVAQKLRTAQLAVVQAKARDRVEAARRAEILASELAKLKGAPSIKALKEAASQ